MTAALIAKLESASEGSDELSAYVIRHFRAPNGEVICSPINGKWCVYTAPGRLLENSSRDGWHRPEGWNVTESIDAALALAERVLPGWRWETRIDDKGATVGCASAWWNEGLEAVDCGGVIVDAATPALAICAALLRASAEEGAGE